MINGARGQVKQMTLAELKSLDIGSRVDRKWKDERIPTFDEILDLCRGRIGIYLDLKDAPLPPLVDLVKARHMEHDVLWYIGASQVDPGTLAANVERAHSLGVRYFNFYNYGIMPAPNLEWVREAVARTM